MKHFLHLLPLLLFGLLTSLSASAKPQEPFKPLRLTRSCRLNLFQPTNPKYAGVNLGSIARADLSKSILIPDKSVLDQGRIGSCWIEATLGRFEREAEKLFGRPIPMSENHMILATLFYRIEEGLYFGNEIFDGGWAHASEWMAEHIGLVPQDAFKPKIDLRSTGVGEETIAHLNREIIKYQDDLAKLKKTKKTPKEVWDFTQSKKSELFKYIRNRFGNFPSSFKVDGIKYTPHSFAKKILADREHDVLSYIEPTEPRITPKLPDMPVSGITREKSLFNQVPAATEFLPVTKAKLAPDGKSLMEQAYLLASRSGMEGVEDLKMPFSKMHNEIAESIEKGEPVHVSVWMAPDYYREDTGVMSLSAFGGDAKIAKNAKIEGGHAILITGVYRDPSSKVVGYRIQNSWGKEAGDLGYFYMDIDYFESFMVDIQILRAPQKRR